MARDRLSLLDEALQSGEARTRRNAIIALGVLAVQGSEEAVDRLETWALKDDAEEVRDTAAGELVQLPPYVLDPIVDRLTEAATEWADPERASRAFATLGAIVEKRPRSFPFGTSVRLLLTATLFGGADTEAARHAHITRVRMNAVFEAALAIFAVYLVIERLGAETVGDGAAVITAAGVALSLGGAFIGATLFAHFVPRLGDRLPRLVNLASVVWTFLITLGVSGGTVAFALLMWMLTSSDPHVEVGVGPATLQAAMVCLATTAVGTVLQAVLVVLGPRPGLLGLRFGLSFAFVLFMNRWLGLSLDASMLMAASLAAGSGVVRGSLPSHGRATSRQNLLAGSFVTVVAIAGYLCAFFPEASKVSEPLAEGVWYAASIDRSTNARFALVRDSSECAAARMELRNQKDPRPLPAWHAPVVDRAETNVLAGVDGMTPTRGLGQSGWDRSDLRLRLLRVPPLLDRLRDVAPLLMPWQPWADPLPLEALSGGIHAITLPRGIWGLRITRPRSYLPLRGMLAPSHLSQAEGTGVHLCLIESAAFEASPAEDPLAYLRSGRPPVKALPACLALGDMRSLFDPPSDAYDQPIRACAETRDESSPFHGGVAVQDVVGTPVSVGWPDAGVDRARALQLSVYSPILLRLTKPDCDGVPPDQLWMDLLWSNDALGEVRARVEVGELITLAGAPADLYRERTELASPVNYRLELLGAREGRCRISLEAMPYSGVMPESAVLYPYQKLVRLTAGKPVSVTLKGKLGDDLIRRVGVVWREHEDLLWPGIAVGPVDPRDRSLRARPAIRSCDPDGDAPPRWVLKQDQIRLLTEHPEEWVVFSYDRIRNGTAGCEWP